MGRVIVQQSAMISIPNNGRVDRDELERLLAVVPVGVDIYADSRSIKATWVLPTKAEQEDDEWSKRPIRHRAECPGCHYRHVISVVQGEGQWRINSHNAPGGGLCSGSSAPIDAPVEPVKGPGPNTEGKVTVSGGIEFIPWPKIARLANETMVITEKIDGTNACVQFRPGDPDAAIEAGLGRPYKFAAQSRTRLITPTSDNHGFAAWAYENQESLFADLGYGVHFGEWWGAGIQRKYGLDHRRFSLFNTHRWDAKRGHFATPNLDVVPLLYTGPVNISECEERYDLLRRDGSKAAPGFDNPEGIVVYLTATGRSFLLDDQDTPESYWKLTDAPAPKGPKDEHGNAG